MPRIVEIILRLNSSESLILLLAKKKERFDVSIGDFDEKKFLESRPSG